MSVEDQMQVLNYKKINADKLEKQKSAMSKLPYSISVTYTGDESFYSHRGRSRAAKRDPYRFSKDIPVEVTIKEDIKFFMFLGKTNKKMWTVKSGAEAKNVLDAEAEKVAEVEKKGLARKKAQAEKMRKARASRKKTKEARDIGLEEAEENVKEAEITTLESEIKTQEEAKILEEAEAKSKIPAEVIEANKKAQEEFNKTEGVEE